MDWDAFDFAVAAALLIGAGVAVALAARASDLRHRAAVCAAPLAAFLFIWAELAVGVVGSPIAGS
jgi:hypothetical protein